MNIQYKKLNINYVIKDIIVINNTNVNVFELNITKDNCLINLGNFYSDMNIEDNIGYLIDNLDDIMLNKYRYLGNNDEILTYFKNNAYNDKNICDIYTNYLYNDNIDVKKYSRFLELYFCNHNITDNIRKLFLEKYNKKVLDNNDIDFKIREAFTGSMYDMALEREYRTNIDNLTRINNEKNLLYNEINLLNEIADIINKLNKVIKFNYNILVLINKKKSELEKINFFDKRKKQYKLEIKKLERELNAEKINIIKSNLNSKMKEYTDKYKGEYLYTLYKNVGLNDLSMMINDICKNKRNVYGKLDEEGNNLTSKINEYENYENEMDLTDLYDILDSKVKVQV